MVDKAPMGFYVEVYGGVIGFRRVFSPVYSVDSVENRFLVVDRRKRFRWVSMDDCRVAEEWEVDIYGV